MPGRLWCSVALIAGAAIGVVACRESAPPAPAAAQRRAAGDYDRTVLPIAEPKPPTYTELDARNAKPPARFEVKAPKGAPNVVIVLIDDIGF
ncbi:MAG: arylsulfatase, partial [Lysobacterales bacterium]